jgi:hypothetical protein
LRFGRAGAGQLRDRGRWTIYTIYLATIPEAVQNLDTAKRWLAPMTADCCRSCHLQRALELKNGVHPVVSETALGKYTAPVFRLARQNRGNNTPSESGARLISRKSREAKPNYASRGRLTPPEMMKVRSWIFIFVRMMGWGRKQMLD